MATRSKVDLQPLPFLYFGFESRRGHRYLSVVNLCTVQVAFSATGRSLVQRSPTDCVCVCVCVCVSLSVIRCNNNLVHLHGVGRRGHTKEEINKERNVS